MPTLFTALRAHTQRRKAQPKKAQPTVSAVVPAAGQTGYTAEIFAVPAVPKTITGKKLEVPLKRILMGVPAENAASAGSLANPGSLQYFVDLAEARSGR